MREEIRQLIEQVLRHGGNSINVADVDEELIKETEENLSQRGFSVRRMGTSLLFETKTERKLLKG